jgi:hypothetical protein
VIDHRLDSWWGQTKDYEIGISCFSAKHAALRRKNKDLLAWNQDNVFVFEQKYFIQFSKRVRVNYMLNLWWQTFCRGWSKLYGTQRL